MSSSVVILSMAQGTTTQSLTSTGPVRQHRKALRLTQADLAKAVGVSRQTIVSVEQGDYAPSVFLALRIGRVLETPVEELFLLIDHEGEH